MSSTVLPYFKMVYLYGGYHSICSGTSCAGVRCVKRGLAQNMLACVPSRLSTTPLLPMNFLSNYFAPLRVCRCPFHLMYMYTVKLFSLRYSNSDRKQRRGGEGYLVSPIAPCRCNWSKPSGFLRRWVSGWLHGRHYPQCNIHKRIRPLLPRRLPPYGFRSHKDGLQGDHLL